MWYVRAFLLILFVVIVLLFGLINSGAEFNLRLWDPAGAGFTVNAVVALFVAFVLGGLLFFFVSLYREIRLRRECGRLGRELAKAKRELDALRMAPLDGPLPGSTGTPTEPSDPLLERGDEA